MIGRPYLLLGEAPNAATARHPRLWLLPDGSGILHSANRLLGYTGYDLERYLATFDRDNLIHHLPRRTGKGRGFPIAAARRGVRRIFDDGERYAGILVLGKRAAAAFNWRTAPKPNSFEVARGKMPYLVWGLVEEHRREYASNIRAAIVPHPSGVKQWWNDPKNRRAARQFFRALDSRK